MLKRSSAGRPAGPAKERLASASAWPPAPPKITTISRPIFSTARSPSFALIPARTRPLPVQPASLSWKTRTIYYPSGETALPSKVSFRETVLSPRYQPLASLPTRPIAARVSAVTLKPIRPATPPDCPALAPDRKLYHLEQWLCRLRPARTSNTAPLSIMPGPPASPTPTPTPIPVIPSPETWRSEEHTSELQSQSNLVCRLLLE